MLADKPPEQQVTPEDRRQALFVWRKIAVMQAVQCCGMCGTVRHQTKPYWSLGMRVCRQCVQANLISSIVLYERFWITFKHEIRGHISFADLVHLNTFYFRTHVTPHQRLEYSTDPLDFPVGGGSRAVWFFWKPHLSMILDFELLALEAREKDRAAAVIRGFARRARLLRILAGTSRRTSDFLQRKDKRTVLAEARKSTLLNRVDTCMEQRQCLRLAGEQFARFLRGEDRLPPLLFG
jgi:hypothetical protein